MTKELAKVVDDVQVTDEQRDKFLALIREDKAIGSVDALRKAGVAGSRGQLRAWLKQDGDLEQAAREARGWNLNRVEAAAWQVAVNTDHPSWDRANARILKAYHPAFRDQAHVEVEHTGHVEIEDRSATLVEVKAVLLAVGGFNGSGTDRGSVSPGRALLPADPQD